MTERETSITPARGFLSRVTCSSRLGQAWQLATPYEQHRTLWRLFSEHDGRDFLFREQQTKGRWAGAPRRFIIVSSRPPHGTPGFEVETREYAPQLANGDVLAFTARLSVTASQPVQRPTSPSEPLHGRGKTVDPIAEALASASSLEDRRSVRKNWLIGGDVGRGQANKAPLLVSNWLAPRLFRHGLEVVPTATRIATYEPAMHQGHKAKDSITFSVAEFHGVVRVVESELALAAAFAGVGRGKSMGYGLLLFSRRASTADIPHVGSDAEDEEEAPA